MGFLKETAEVSFADVLLLPARLWLSLCSSVGFFPPPLFSLPAAPFAALLPAWESISLPLLICPPLSPNFSTLAESISFPRLGELRGSAGPSLETELRPDGTSAPTRL